MSFINFYMGYTVFELEFQIPLLMTFINFNFEELKTYPEIDVFICRKEFKINCLASDISDT